MAFELHRGAFPGLAASAIDAHQAVRLVDAERGVAPANAGNQEPFGVALATAAQGEAVTAHDVGNVVKAVAGASLGAGANVGVTGATASLSPIAGASGVIRFSVGKSVTAAATGEVFSLYVNPQQLSDGGAI